jgi:hypothetical protein
MLRMELKALKAQNVHLTAAKEHMNSLNDKISGQVHWGGFYGKPEGAWSLKLFMPSRRKCL